MSSFVAPLIWTTVVALALWPPVRGGTRLGFAVYVLTMAINELPMVFLALIALLMAANQTEPPGGAIGVAWLLLWGFVAVGFVWLQWRAGRARPALDAALDSALGPGWRSAIEPGRAAMLSTSTPWLAGIFLPFQRRRRNVQRTRNITYGPDPAHRLDLYRGPAPSAARPILIHFHEGGFTQGGKSREAVTLFNQLAAHGWLCLSANYRLREAGRFPNPLIDAKRAIAWAREHAPEHGADPELVFLAGSSAGGHMAVNAALTPNRRRLQPGFEQADTSVLAVVSAYGYLGARTDDPASNPAGLAGPDSPPMFLIQGTNDTDLPAGMPPRWAASLRSGSGSPVAYAELPGAQHAFDLFASVRARASADAVEAFLAWAVSTVARREQPRPS